MKTESGLYIFGEVLFDCFPSGEEVLGGAPFNVAWHLQALGDTPLFISRVGNDVQGDRIVEAMQSWGMNLSALQKDPNRPTGRVNVEIIDNEPQYDIVANSGYDAIDASALPLGWQTGILYHGTLALREKRSQQALEQLAGQDGQQIFLDVNLRAPWWQKAQVLSWLQKAHWAKMNEHELALLTDSSQDIGQQMDALLSQCGLEQLIVTCGAEGARVLTQQKEHFRFQAKEAPVFVDTVGAGDAFSAVYIHGLRAGWSLADIGCFAQDFASRVIGLRGATTNDPAFYRNFLQATLGR
nr:carbohydrate kinase [uncultured Desulfobulbus sp.]